MTNLLDSIRPAGVCKMFVSLARSTRPVEFCKALWSLYNIKQPCINLQDL